MNDLVFAAVLASIGTVLLWLFWTFAWRPFASRKERANPRFVADGQGEVREKGVGVRSCPVCGEKLQPGALVKSKVWKGTSSDKVMQIYGCPYCWPENTEYRRVCPVCEKVVPRGGYLIARYFEKPGHRHVHVLGCSGCRRG
ncbi:MAG: hypothetical protein CVV51_02170 [Spirochaetae bacterium HGW-Spirochaetae-7]|nr:MAG: hypothetical protein CVV51_02170 [Spirochaetae bacterium HGW-Spirochaetae-7]